MKTSIEAAAEIIKNSKHTTAFTGAGISVESGIPPFRGASGLWNKYDPDVLDIDRFYQDPHNSWKVIRDIFYDFFGKAKPNDAHIVLAQMEEKGLLKAIITQNIDNLHQEAGSKTVYEFHGNSHSLICIKCSEIHSIEEVNLTHLPPKCRKCTGILKPNFIFFGEGIPNLAYTKSLNEAENAEAFIVIGTTGEVMPACSIPITAKRHGCKIIEVNTEKSTFTNSITDIYLQGRATEIMNHLGKLISLH